MVDLGRFTTPEVIYSTGVANSSAMGLDIGVSQAAAVRFAPSSNCTATEIELSLMSNGPNATMVAQIVWGGEAAPSNGKPIGASGDFQVQAVTWKPEQQTVGFVTGVPLIAGEAYWIVLRSRDPMGSNGVWLLGPQRAWSTTTMGGAWQHTDQKSAAPGVILRGIMAGDIHGAAHI